MLLFSATPLSATPRLPLSCALLTLLGLLLPVVGVAQSAPPAKIQVMVVGSDHLNQLYNKQPASDVFSPKKQAELAQVRAQLARFRPDLILIEAAPKEQTQIDSLPINPQVVELPFWRVYEHIVKGQLSAEYVALLSTSAGMDGVGTYVSVLRRRDWTPVVVFAYTQWWEEQWDEEARAFKDGGLPWSRHPFDLALQGHTLVLACPGALLCADLRAFPVRPMALPDEPQEPDYAGVDLDSEDLPAGVHWETLALHEQPTTICFVGQRQLLGTVENIPDQEGRRTWVKNLGD